ncbi:MAG: zf-HC2 domain-containing protein, partial [candidate division Zixibacteria bacterium]|nr:zf-HC2 domain-containing protein [candidate division Zixibacteria bacterium]
MNCENIKEKLSLYIDDLLDANEAEKIREHIKNCDSCRAYYNKLLKLGEMVDDFAISENEDYWEAQKDKVIEKIDQAQTDKIVKVQSDRKQNKYYKYLAVAASIALVAFVSIYESREFDQ